LPLFPTKDAALDAIADYWLTEENQLEWLVDC
jgi:hypothetical protein